MKIKLNAKPKLKIKLGGLKIKQIKNNNYKPKTRIYAKNFSSNS